LYLLDWYRTLKRTREPLSYSEIKAWSDLTASDPNPDEVETLMLLDNDFSSVLGEDG